MSLAKRNGPLLLGIHLDRTRSNGCYVPLFHVHNLAWPSTDVALGLCQGVSVVGAPGLRQEIPDAEHQARYLGAAEKLLGHVPELGAKETSFCRVLALYRDFLAQRRDPAICRYPLGLLTDEILLWSWAGEVWRAKECYEAALARIESWPAQQVDLSAWQSAIRGLMDKGHLDAVVQQEIVRHGVSAIPEYPLHADEGSIECLAAMLG